MAQACPSPILDTVLNKLGFPIFQKTKLNCRLRTQLGVLRSKLELLREVADDAEGMAVLFPEFVGDWVCDLQRVLFELDDVLDEALTRSMPPSAVLEKVRLRLYSLPFDLTIAHKIKKISSRLTSIVEECYKCNLIVEPRNRNEKPVARKGILRYDPSYVRDDEFCMIGKDDDKEKVVQMLSDDDPSRPAVWITGTPGVGKTTLCRAVYNDEHVKNQFELRLWITLGGHSDFSTTEFWKKIIRTFLEADEAGASQPDAEMKEEDTEVQLKGKVFSLIGKKKTLLVVDNFPPLSNLVDEFDSCLSLDFVAAGNKGSKIIFSHFDPRKTFLLGCAHEVVCDLSEVHCSSIFKNTAFAPRHDSAQQPPPEWMVDLGKQIVSKCASHPALLRGVGTLLYRREDRATWENFARVDGFNNHIQRYWFFSHINTCFPNCQHNVGYLSLFSKHKFKYEALIQQFTAHKFTNLPNNMRQHLKGHFLYPVEESEDNWDTKDEYDIWSHYKYDILKLAGAESTFLEWTETYLPKYARHVSLVRPSSSSSKVQRHQDRILPHSLIKDVIHRRSLLFLGELLPIGMSVQTLDTLASNLRYLRVLDLQDMALQVLPTSIGKLIHLRYLDLSRNDFRMLPRSIYRLRNLVTLKLIYCDKLIRLPQHIKELSHLKQLGINMCLDLTDMPSTIARMTCLEMLDRFIVSPHSGGLGYLEHLNHLNGHLSIELPRHWEKSKADANQANLESKRGLTSLEFKWQGADNDDEMNDDYDVLEKLKPCSGIENLSILNFGGKTFPSWITFLGMENGLTEITISQCKRCKILPSFHEMPNLKFLTLTSMNIEYLQDASILRSADVFFQSLKVLKIGRMPHLKGWWDLNLIGPSIVADDLPTVENVEIWSCPCLKMVPPFSVGKMVLQDVSHKMLQTINCMKINEFELINIQDMGSLPNQMILMFLWRMRIKGCSSLQELWVDEAEGIIAVRQLRELEITNCPTLKHLSSNLGHLTDLRWLTISKCSEELDCLHEDKEDGMPWKALQRLISLRIEGFQNLVALPKGLQCLPFLNDLTITNCPAMKHLSNSLRHVSPLRSLYIAKCSEELDFLYKDDQEGMPWKALKSLKNLTIEGFENLTALPKGLQQLKLSILKIIDCKALKWEFGSLPKSNRLTVKSCPHFSTRIKELEAEHKTVKVLE